MIDQNRSSPCGANLRRVGRLLEATFLLRKDEERMISRVPLSWDGLSQVQALFIWNLFHFSLHAFNIYYLLMPGRLSKLAGNIIHSRHNTSLALTRSNSASLSPPPRTTFTVSTKAPSARSNRPSTLRSTAYPTITVQLIRQVLGYSGLVAFVGGEGGGAEKNTGGRHPEIETVPFLPVTTN